MKRVSDKSSEKGTIWRVCIGRDVSNNGSTAEDTILGSAAIRALFAAVGGKLDAS